MDIPLFLEDNRLVLTDTMTDRSPVYVYAHTVIPLLISKIRRENLKEVYLYHPFPEKALEDIKKYFDIIEAAGGVVRNENGDVLFIYRRGVWDLPKGKIEEGETAEQTALREVKEECGVEELSNEKFLEKTYHLFKEGGRRKMKITHWFLMEAPSASDLRPQSLEGIEQVRWISPGDEDFKNTARVYESIRLILSKLNFW